MLKLKEVPKIILDFPQLEQLDIQRNSISELPSFLFKLTNLRVLSAQNNHLSHIPPEIGSLTQLVRLNLNDNRIVKIDKKIGLLQNLTTLYLNRNRLISIPNTISELNSLKVLSINENSLSIPYEIINGSIEGLKNYLESLGEGQTFKLCEAKLLVVGEGDVGKTQLCHAILSGIQNDPSLSTKGIEISNWIVRKDSSDKEYVINLWDFGGQEIYHSTHQYFLTKKSLYIFLWSARTDDDLHFFDYWLNVISLLSDKSPTLVIQNKIDIRTKEIDTRLIRGQFENVIGFLNTSAVTGEGIDELRNRIIVEVEKLPHFHQIVPLAWVKIRKYLEDSNQPFMMYEDYLVVCNNNGLGRERAAWLSEYFHILGVFLHFPDNLILSQIIFLQPEWATGSVYKLFDDSEVISNRGYFTSSTLKRVWSEYPKEQYPALLELMKKFELCFEVPSKQHYIVPSRLPASPDTELPQLEKNLPYYYQYEFMPAGIIERLIVRLHALIDNNYFWKNGVVFKRESTIAIVEADRFKKRISIKLEGTAKSDLLAIIRNEIEQIHITLNSPIFTEKVPCVCKECLDASTPFLHSYHIIERARSKKKKTIECQNSFLAVEISALLGGLDGTIESKENQIFELLKGLVDRFDTEETLEEKLNESLHLKPNLFGVGVNLNYLIAKALKKSRVKQ
jgi:GTPase SAR1 family protein